MLVAHVVTRRAVSCYGDAEIDDFWTLYRVMCMLCVLYVLFSEINWLKKVRQRSCIGCSTVVCQLVCPPTDTPLH